MREALNFIGEKVAIGLLATALFTAVGFVFLFRGRKAFEIVDDFLEKHELADIERGES